MRGETNIQIIWLRVSVLIFWKYISLIYHSNRLIDDNVLYLRLRVKLALMSAGGKGGGELYT